MLWPAIHPASSLARRLLRRCRPARPFDESPGADAVADEFTVEQIVAKLREAERLQGQGLTIPQLCKRLQISDQNYGPRARVGRAARAIHVPAEPVVAPIVGLWE